MLSPTNRQIPTRYAPVRHSSARASSAVTVRLACVKHTASVQSEPWSNSSVLNHFVTSSDVLPIFARLSEFTFVNPKINGVDSYIDYLYHANNLYKYPHKLFWFVFLKSSERWSCSAESDNYTESELVVNVLFSYSSEEIMQKHNPFKTIISNIKLPENTTLTGSENPPQLSLRSRPL